MMPWIQRKNEIYQQSDKSHKISKVFKTELKLSCAFRLLYST